MDLGIFHSSCKRHKREKTFVPRGVRTHHQKNQSCDWLNLWMRAPMFRKYKGQRNMLNCTMSMQSADKLTNSVHMFIGCLRCYQLYVFRLKKNIWKEIDQGNLNIKKPHKNIKLKFWQNYVTVTGAAHIPRSCKCKQMQREWVPTSMEHEEGFWGDKVLIWLEWGHKSIWLIMFLPVLFSRSVFYLTIKHWKKVRRRVWGLEY